MGAMIGIEPFNDLDFADSVALQTETLTVYSFDWTAISYTLYWFVIACIIKAF